MSEDWIKRSDAIKALGDAHFKNWGNAVLVVQDIPTIEPKRGEWIEQEDCWQCSECGDEYVLEVDVKPIDARMHYCPNCGCRMKGADDE